MRGLKEKVALVTGAGRGIGRAIAIRLAEEGAKVAVLDVDEAAARSTAAEIGGFGLRMDVTDRDSVGTAIAEAERRLGPTDVLVNNAGWDRIEPFVKSSEETWDKVIAINLKGPIRCTRAVLDGMIARGRGRIVNISSDAGRVGSSGEAVYSAAKAGLIGFSKTLARELARHRIGVNVVCPGPTNTQLLKDVSADNPKIVEALKRAVPFGRIGEPEEIAAAVAFLASDDAAFITGQTLSVSGGLTMA